MKKAAPLLLALALLGGCSSATKTATPLLGNNALQLTATRAIPMFDIASAAIAILAIQLIFDPLAPNWEIEETRVSEDTYRYSLKMKRYHTGGAGESMQVLKRRISQVQQELGYGGYQLMEYSEGIESQTLGARRYAEGTVKLVQRKEADSFLQN